MKSAQKDRSCPAYFSSKVKIYNCLRYLQRVQCPFCECLNCDIFVNRTLRFSFHIDPWKPCDTSRKKIVPTRVFLDPESIQELQSFTRSSDTRTDLRHCCHILGGKSRSDQFEAI